MSSPLTRCGLFHFLLACLLLACAIHMRAQQRPWMSLLSNSTQHVCGVLPYPLCAANTWCCDAAFVELCLLCVCWQACSCVHQAATLHTARAQHTAGCAATVVPSPPWRPEVEWPRSQRQPLLAGRPQQVPANVVLNSKFAWLSLCHQIDLVVPGCIWPCQLPGPTVEQFRFWSPSVTPQFKVCSQG